MAYGLSLQIKENKSMGLESLKTFMKNDILKNQKPDFSNIGLDDAYLMMLSKQFSDQRNNMSTSQIKSNK